MQQTPSGANVTQKDTKGKGSSNLKYFCAFFGCITVPAALFLVGVIGFLALTADGGEIDKLLRKVESEKELELKATNDLELIRNALSLHDAQNRPLNGTSLTPLLGRYLQELPKDPWRNDYLFDSAVGVILTYGADGIAGGKGSDKDIVIMNKKPLTLHRIQYVGPWGYPSKGNQFLITLNKPLEIVDEDELLKSLVLFTNSRDFSDGRPFSFDELNKTCGHNWKLDKDECDPRGKRTLLFKNDVAGLSKGQTVTPTMAMNFVRDAKLNVENSSETELVRFGLKEHWLPIGPLDPSIYGSDAKEYLSAPEPFKDGRIRYRLGMKIERY